MAFYGAIFGGALALLIGSWRYGMNLWSVLDLGALGMTIGQAFGRIGNIINGDIVGYPTGGRWGFVYTSQDTFAPRNVAVQPANLYELLIAVALFILLWSIRKRVQPEGMLAMVYIVLYSVSQFLIFFVRDNVVLFHGLKQAQLTAIVVTVLTIPFILYLLRRGPRLSRSSTPAAQKSPVGEATG